MEWYLFQHGGIDTLAKAAYTWRAAQLLDTPVSTAVSTCRLFALHGRNQPGTSQEALNRRDANVGHGRAFLAIDEGSFLSAPHLFAAHTQCCRARGADQTAMLEAFGNLHTAIFLDLRQHGGALSLN